MTLSEISIYKKWYRARCREILNHLRPSERNQKSIRIYHHLIQDPILKRSVAFFTFLGFKNEIDTMRLVYWGLSQGKIVVAPRVDFKSKQIELYQILLPSRDLKIGAFGIPEPDPKKCKPVSISSLDLLIVPGLAFDRSGGRLGRGAGYFDRFLAQCKNIPKIGIAFREQMISQVPLEAHDIRMDQVICD